MYATTSSKSQTVQLEILDKHKVPALTQQLEVSSSQTNNPFTFTHTHIIQMIIQIWKQKCCNCKHSATWQICNNFCMLQHKQGDGGDRHWLVRMEWRSAGWSVCLPPLIFPCTIKSRSSLLARAHPGGPGKGAVKRLSLWCGGGTT